MATPAATTPPASTNTIPPAGRTIHSSTPAPKDSAQQPVSYTHLSGGKRAGGRKMPAVKGGFFCCGVEVAVFADRPDRHFPDGAPVGLAARFPAVDGQFARFLKAEKRGVDVGNVLRGLHVHRRLRRLNRRAVPFAAALQPSAAAGVKRPKLFGKILVVPHDAVLVYAAGDVVDVRVADIAERKMCIRDSKGSCAFAAF